MVRPLIFYIFATSSSVKIVPRYAAAAGPRGWCASFICWSRGHWEDVHKKRQVKKRTKQTADPHLTMRDFRSSVLGINSRMTRWRQPTLWFQDLCLKVVMRLTCFICLSIYNSFYIFCKKTGGGELVNFKTNLN